MSEVSSAAVAATGTKFLWAAVGVLGAAVVGLGGALYVSRTPSNVPSEPVAAAPVSTVVASAPVPEPVRTEATPAPEVKPKAKPKAKVAHVKSEPAVTPVAVAQPEPVPVMVKPICAACATVVAVTPVEHEGEGSAAGAVAGGVLGALVGNQFGRGSGKDLATIVGAVGGGIAGNKIEKQMHKTTTYQTELRMDDGSRRTLEMGVATGVGSRVRIEGSTLIALPAGQ